MTCFHLRNPNTNQARLPERGIASHLNQGIDSAHLVLNPQPEGHSVKEKKLMESISRRNMLAAAAAGGFLTAANAAAAQTSAEPKEDQMGNIRKEPA